MLLLLEPSDVKVGIEPDKVAEGVWAPERPVPVRELDPALSVGISLGNASGFPISRLRQETD